jgi:hypothetical protein
MVGASRVPAASRRGAVESPAAEGTNWTIIAVLSIGFLASVVTPAFSAQDAGLKK